VWNGQREDLDRQLGDVLGDLESLLGRWRWVLHGIPSGDGTQGGIKKGVAAAMEVLVMEAPGVNWPASLNDWLYGLLASLAGDETCRDKRLAAIEGLEGILEIMRVEDFQNLSMLAADALLQPFINGKDHDDDGGGDGGAAIIMAASISITMALTTSIDTLACAGDKDEDESKQEKKAPPPVTDSDVDGE